MIVGCKATLYSLHVYCRGGVFEVPDILATLRSFEKKYARLVPRALQQTNQIATSHVGEGRAVENFRDTQMSKKSSLSLAPAQA